MPKRPLHFLLFWLGLAASAGSSAVSVKPQEVRDLHYGEVLFHFYQEDYFTAITHLLVAQQQGLLQHHEQESELLLGGLQLSYGMLDQAEARFDRLLDEKTDAELRNRVWYYLTKIAYQRGRHEQALGTLQKIDKPRDKKIGAELALLNANLHMETGQNAEAAEILENAPAPEGWEEYLRINRGIALLRAGNTEQGRAILDKLGKHRAGNEELRALRDRANLGLGYELLRKGDAEQARRYLNRVRLQGPFMQAALLGAGWADVERGDYEQALTPWLALMKLSSHDAAVQEAHLAVPYAFTRIGDNQRSNYFYQQALDFFDREQQYLVEAIQAARSGALVSLLSHTDNEPGLSGGWLNKHPTLEDVPSGRYLVDILSGHQFQESLKDYRDLGYLEQLLHSWLENISLYYDMVEARRLAYEQRAPRVRKRMARQEAAAFQQRWQDYSALVQAERRNGDPLNLATGKEKQQWITLQKVQEKLAALPAEARYLKMQDKARWLQGVLYWQVQSNYKARLREAEKQVQELGNLVNDTLGKHRQVSAALDDVRAGFDGFDTRIETLRKRILALLPGIDIARNKAGSELQALALKELETRRQRLASYRLQARYALARSYDQVAQQPESGDGEQQ
ncbi:MAG: tetratricopeptide repeat protein [Thiogranum sp.]